jgi:hypothetical protein
VTAFAFPPAGLLANETVGRVDEAAAAAAAGAISGVVIGTVQWLFLRKRGVSVAWIAGTAIGMAAGLTAGAAAVDYETSFGALAAMGLATGIGVGLGQAVSFAPLRKQALAWSLATGVLWAVGWAVTTASGIDVDEQWTVFGISGAIVVALLQSFIIGRAVPPTASETNDVS